MCSNNTKHEHWWHAFDGMKLYERSESAAPTGLGAIGMHVGRIATTLALVCPEAAQLVAVAA